MQIHLPALPRPLLALLVSAPWLCASPGAAVPLPDALESGALVWRTGGGAPWFGSTLASHDGVDAARSGGGGSGESWMETDLTGPGALSFWVKSETIGARVLLNDTGQELSPGGWTQRKLRLGPGAQRVRFLAPHNEPAGTGADALFLDELNLAPAPAVSPGEAVDAPGLTWTGSVGMFGYSEAGEGVSGGDFIVVQVRGATPGEVSANVTGPAAVRFRWKMTGYAPEAQFKVRAGAFPLTWTLPADPSDGSRGSEMWYDAEVLVPSGPQVIQWLPDAGGDFLLDAVNVAAAPSAGAAVGQPGLTWTGDWLTRTAPAAIGGAVAVTPLLDGPRTATLSALITGPAEVSYVSSLLRQTPGEPLTPHGVVGVKVDHESGTLRTAQLPNGWFRSTFFVPEGEHYVSWVAADLDQSNFDTWQGVLDEVTVTPAGTASLTAALKTTLSSQVTEGAALSGRWRGMKSLTSGLNGSAVVCGPLVQGEATTLSLPVSGPARLLFSVRGERWTWEREVKLTGQLDGADVLPFQTVTGPPGATVPPLPPADWRTLMVSIPSGAHTLTLRASDAAPGALLWLDAVGYLPADPGASKIAAAVEMSGTEWRRISPPGRGAWRVLATPMAREGKTLSACMDVPAGQSASVETTLAGPGVLTFSWGQAVDGVLSVSVNDAEAARAWSAFSSDSPRGELVELLLPPGPQTVRWTYTRANPPTPSPAAAQAWLDAVKFTPPAAGDSPVPGLDVTAAVTTDTDWPWRTAAPTFSATGDGDAAMVEVPEAGAAFLEMPLNGPGRFAFWWRAEAGYLNHQSVALSVDSQEIAWLPDINNWYRSEITVGPGAHTLRWLVKAASRSLRREDMRRVWLDGFTQLPTLPLAGALDNSLTWTTGAPSDTSDFTDWTGLPAPETAANPGTDDAAVTPGTRPLTTQITGPGVVTFRWAEKSVPPLPSLEAPASQPAPGSPMVLGGGTLGLAMTSIGGWNWDWWYRPPPPRAVFAVNGTSRATLDLTEGSFDSAWAAHTIHLGPGEHTLTWQRPARSNGRRLVVESVSFAPAPDVFAPVAAELGVPVSGFTMTDTPWTVQSAQTHDGSAALKSGVTASGQSTLERSFTGPGELSFWWKGTAGADFRNPFYDPDPNGWIIVIGPEPWLAPAEWQRFTLSIPAGQHRYSWRAAPGATLWLDEVTYSTPQPLAGPNVVAEALDSTALTWIAPGWQPMTGPGLSDTGDALVGPEAGAAEPPWLETTVTGPATLRFTWKMEAFPPAAATTSGAVTLKLLLDGVESIVTAGNSADSGTPDIHVPAGPHTLRLLFHSTTAQHRRPVVDDARLLMPTGDALGAPALTWTSTPPSAPWHGWLSDRCAGHTSWVESPIWRDGDATHFALSTTVTGPSLVSFDVLLPAPAPAPDGHTWQISTETLVLEVDGVEIWRAPAAADSWQTVTAFAGPGAHTFVWKAGRNFRCRLDNCIITPDPAPQPTLAEALETPGREFFGALYDWPPDWSPLRSAASGSRDDSAIAFYDSSRASSLRTTVQGPAWVTFDYRSSGLALKVITDDGLRYTLDPDYIYSGSPPPAPVWRTAPRVFIPAGAHDFLWETGNRLATAPVPWVQVDNVVITSLYSAPGEVALAEAIDAPGLTFTSTGTAWTGRSVAGATGGDAAVVISTSANASLVTSVTGPGTLFWRWKLERFGTYWSGNPASFSMSMDSANRVTLDTGLSADWQTAEWPVPPGAHEVHWFLRSQFNNSIAWLDDVRFIAAPTMAEALELPAGLVVNVQAGAPAPVTLRNGSDAVFLDAAVGNGPILSATLTGPGELAFDWKNSLPPDSHTRMVTVDGQPAGYWYPPYAPGTYVFTTSRAFIAVGPGEHVIRWHANFPNGGDGAGLWLDHFTWSAGVPAWVQAAGGIGSNGVSAWITGGTPAWSEAASTGFNNNAAARSADGWLAAVVPPGPGTLCWWGRTTDDTPGSGSLQGPGQYSFLSRDWRFVRASRTAGQPPPLWRAHSEAFVTGINFTPAVTVPLPQALDAPAMVFQTSPDSPWSGIVTEGAPQGTSAAKSGYSADGGSWISANFTGPGRLEFSARFLHLGSTTLAAQANVRTDTILRITDTPITGTEWQNVTLWLDSGPQTVTWTLQHGSPGDEFWLDNVKFTSSVPISLAQALEYSGAPWTTGGAANWEGIGPLPGVLNDGGALSPPLSAGEESWLETTVPGSGVLTWRWRIEDTTRGGIYFELDGLPLTHLYRAQLWHEERWELPAGPHTLRWRCTSQTGPDRHATVDAVTFTPGPPPAWNAALGALSFPMGGGGVSPWRVVTEDGAALLRYEPQTFVDGYSMVFADVTGPAILKTSLRAEVQWYFWRDDYEIAPYTNGEWEELNWFIPAGRHRLRWGGIGPIRVDLRGMSLTSLATVPLAEAVEAAGLNVFNDAANSWAGVREPGRPGDDDYAVALAGPDAAKSLEVEFTGPGILRAAWDWPEDDAYQQTLRLMEGDRELSWHDIGWDSPRGHLMEQRFGPGTHRVSLTAHSPSRMFEARLTRVQFEQWPAVDLATAIGAPGRAFTTGGENWVAGLVRPEIANQGNSVVWMQADATNALAEPWLETEVTGPAQVSFWWRVSAPNFSNLRVRVDDVVYRSFTNYSDLEAEGSATVRIPPGNHRLRWQWQRASGPVQPGTLDSALLDRLVITPAATLSLSEAADAPGLTFTPMAGDWRGWQSEEAVTGGDFIEVSRSDSAAVTLNVPLTGPGVLRWSWRNDTPGWGHGFSALLQNRVMAEVQVAGIWQAGFIAVPPGAQTVTFEMGGSIANGALGRLDNFTWQPTSAGLTAAAAVEASGLTNIAPDTPGDWFPLESAALSSDGTDALVAGVPGRDHRLRANATGPGTLSYVTNAFAVGGGMNLAPVQLYADGSLSTPAALQWATANYRVLHFTGGSTAHTFDWVQTFPAFYRTQYDYAWLDELTFTPAAPAPLAVAVDQPAWTFATGGPVPWQGGTSPAGVNGSLAYTLLNLAAPSAPDSWLETSLIGPGLLFGDFITPYGTSRIYINGAPNAPEMPVMLAPGPNVIRWAVRQSAPAVEATATLDNLEWFPATWADWQAHHFPAGTPAAVSDLTADPDHDGRPNGLEALLGSSPLRADTAPPLTVSHSAYSSPRIIFDYTIFPPEGLTLAIESAASPAGPWSAVTECTAPGFWTGTSYLDTTTPARARERRYFHAGGEAASFYRMRVTQQP